MAYVCYKYNSDTIRAALLHDMHEAYSGDITRPMKSALKRLADGKDIVHMLEGRIDQALHKYFSFTPTPEEVERVTLADSVVLTWERDKFMTECDVEWDLPDLSKEFDEKLLTPEVYFDKDLCRSRLQDQLYIYFPHLWAHHV